LSNQIAVSRESQPRKVLEECLLELRTAAGPIVIFDAQQHAAVSAVGARSLPDIRRVEDMAEVEVAGGGGGETSDDGHESIPGAREIRRTLFFVKSS
jgi:hypothetical protein